MFNSEEELFANFVGKTVNLNLLNSIGHANGRSYGSYSDCFEYYVSNIDWQQNAELSSIFFGDSKSNDYVNIDLSVYLYIRNATVIGGHIYKWEKFPGNDKRPSGYAPDIEGQDLQITRRILSYLVIN